MTSDEIKSLFNSEDGKWVGAIDCHLCKKRTPTKESYITENYCSAFGVTGHWNVIICKECHREKQLSNIFKSEKQE